MGRLNFLNRWANPIKTRVMLMIGRCVLTALDDSTGYQVAQVRAGENEIASGLIRIQNFGFTSRPKPGAAGIAAFIGGNRDHGVLLAVDDARYRVKVAEGEAAVYSAFGAKIVLKADGSIEATPASGQSFKVVGPITASGVIHSDLDITAGALNTSLVLHTHAGGTISGSTGVPNP
jgi:phage baseplate assembly protein V